MIRLPFLDYKAGVDVTYDHNFLRFSLFSAKQFAFFLKTQCSDPLFAKFSSVLHQNWQFFSPVCLAKIFLKS
jgi:hypothetical protein